MFRTQTPRSTRTRKFFRCVSSSRRRPANTRRSSGIRPHLDFLEERTLLSTDFWVGGSGCWNNVAHWSTGSVPVTGDDVVIDSLGSTITLSYDASSIHSLKDNATLLISNATLNVASGAEIDSPGTLGAQAGSVVSLTGGVSSGTFEVDAGASLGLTGEQLAPASVVSGGGAVSLTNCTVAGTYDVTGSTFVSGVTEFTGTVASVGDLSLDIYGVTADFLTGQTITTGALTVYGTLTGNDSFVVDGLLTDGGAIVNAGTGAMTVDAYGGIDVTWSSLDGVTLNNHGTATWTGSWLGIVDGAVFNNLAGATFLDQNNGGDQGTARLGETPGGGSGGTFNNAGTYRETGSDPKESVPWIGVSPLPHAR